MTSMQLTAVYTQVISPDLMRVALGFLMIGWI